jgi:bifunctional non-homologous end joining protein LigD
MALTTYRKKRRFGTTPEPRGSTKKQSGGDSFVIQKHDARRLHYDLRLEMDGVLKSWAVTKGPSLVPGEKRLAVHVEDHPLEYGDFEGTIPKGEYGGGTVIVWDRGRWEPIFDAKKGYAKGHLEFELNGDKLHGRWHLVRMARKPREKKENWLLIKADDEHARTEDDPDILEERPESAKSGRLVEDVEGETPGWSSKTGRLDPPPVAVQFPKRARKARFPGFIDPQLADLRANPPSDAKWIHEIKFDGYRLQVQIRAGRVTLLTRSGLDWSEKFGKSIAAAFSALPVEDAIIDGELVVEGAGNVAEFSALQNDLSDGRSDRFVFYAFDLLYLDGHDLRPASLIDRKTALRTLIAGSSDMLRYSDHFEEEGQLVLRHACRLSLEGIVSKLRDAPYRSGRVKDWAKSKCSARQEFVIGGYVPSTTSQKAIGSLAVGYYERGKLIYAGRVGTGYTAKVAADLFKRLDKISGQDNPFSRKLLPEEARNLRFVTPELVAEVEFRNWTADNIIRHASFRGLREDKTPSEVVREGKAVTTNTTAPSFKLTHPDRIYWADVGVTKQGLADYYAEVWPRIGPFTTQRPLSLLRCPDGVGGQCFFQKHSWKGQSKDILEASDPKDKDDEPIVAIDGLPGLIGLVQGGTLEIHPWGSRLNDLERPDMIIMDLDPGDDVAWTAVIAAAGEVRERFRDAGLESFVKTSGGKGLHVVASLEPRAEWDEVKSFTKAIADAMASDAPDRYVATVTKSKRKGKILVDYLRNGRGSTAVAPYSTRARDGAAISMPLAWDELTPAIGPAYFTVQNALPRLAALGSDPWEEFWRSAVPLGGRKKGKRAA